MSMKGTQLQNARAVIAAKDEEIEELRADREWWCEHRAKAEKAIAEWETYRDNVGYWRNRAEAAEAEAARIEQARLYYQERTVTVTATLDIERANNKAAWQRVAELEAQLGGDIQAVTADGKQHRIKRGDWRPYPASLAESPEEPLEISDRDALAAAVARLAAAGYQVTPQEPTP